MLFSIYVKLKLCINKKFVYPGKYGESEANVYYSPVFYVEKSVTFTAAHSISLFYAPLIMLINYAKLKMLIILKLFLKKCF